LFFFATVGVLRRKQPDPGVAAAAGSEDGEADREEKYNAGPHVSR